MSCGLHLADVARWLLALGTLLAAGAGPTLAEAPRCPPFAGQRCALRGNGHNEFTFVVDGLNLSLEYTDSGYFALTCPENLTLDNSALPRFELPLGVKKVHLNSCPVPHSYAAVLNALNVRVLNKLKLYKTGNVTRAQLANLTSVRTLELVQVQQLAADALAAMPRLLRLSLDTVGLPPDALCQLPRSLQELELTDMNTDVPADVLDAMPKLTNVVVRDSHNVSVALGRHVQVLAVDLTAARVPVALPRALNQLAVHGWDERRPVPWATCEGLHTLMLWFTSAEALPQDWVRACSSLRVLNVAHSRQLSALHAATLRGALELKELHITHCALTSLPPGLLDDAGNLTVLDLTGNKLLELPSGLFAQTPLLQQLALAHNQLSGSVYRSLSAVTSLRQLDLSYNDLRDSCGRADDTVRGVSPLETLKMLTHLNLSKTNISLICRDWRDHMPLLQQLNLSGNNFTSVTFADLQFTGTVTVEVILEENNVTRLQYTPGDYERALRADKSRAQVTLDATLACDCRVYWAARALRERGDQLSVSPRCAAGGGALQAGSPLRAVPLSQLECAALERDWPRPLCAGLRCSCAWRWQAQVGRPQRALLVRCAARGLADLRDVTVPLRAALTAAGDSPNDYDWHLHLEQNDISRLDVGELPKYLSVLDLSNNSLSTLDDGALALLDTVPELRLAGNPLDCSCEQVRTVRALQARPRNNTLTCLGGVPLSAADTSCAGPGAGAAAGGAALLVLLAGAALAGLLAHPAARLRLKAALHRRGWLPAAPEDDSGRRYDVFVSFSHADERFVRDELAARLEAPPDALRLCLHYRDWAPGGWIPAQIAASVRASRRTVAVVSAHFLRSAWARAEFREAHALALRDARPRLVVVLLEDPAALPLDERLRRFLENNTYVRWGDPFFWEKLRLALARGPALQHGAAAPAPPVPALPALPALPAQDVRVEPATQQVCASPAAEVCAESSASSLNSTTSSSQSSHSSLSSCPSPTHSAVELDRLMTSCDVQHVAASTQCVAIPV